MESLYIKGADGAFNFWDKDSKQRLKLGTQQSGSPISATCFNRNGTIFAYAVGYDWHKGHEHNKSNQGGTRNVIMLHPVKDEDIKPKPKKR